MTQQDKRKEKFIEEITFEVPITDYLDRKKNQHIKNTLNILDACIKDSEEKAKIRKAILSEFNDFYTDCCVVLTKVQDADIC